MKFRNFYFGFCLLVFVILCVALVGCYTYLAYRTSAPTPPIYAIMITGKDITRYQLALLSIQNFMEQTYPEKYMIIVNHGKKSLLQEHTKLPNIMEVMISKENLTLGELRNFALQFVGIDSYWTTWDDDDWRNQGYLDMLMYGTQLHTRVNVLSSRLEYNSNTNVSWVGTHKKGFVHFAAPWDPRIKYLPLDTMEDVNIIADFQHLGYNVQLLHNNPCMYIRLVHSTNTSLYVRKDKTNLIIGRDYIERYPSTVEQQCLQSIIRNYYKF